MAYNGSALESAYFGPDQGKWRKELMASETPNTHPRIGINTAKELANPDYSEWTLKQLFGIDPAPGRKRGGAQAKLAPMERFHEAYKRLFPEMKLDELAGAYHGMQYLRAVAEGKAEPNNGRIDTSKYLVNRAAGNVPQRFEFEFKEPSEYERAGVTDAIVIRPMLELDSEEVTGEDDDPFGFNEPEPDEPERKRERRRRRRDSRKEQSAAEETDERTHTANYPMRWHKDEEDRPKR